MALAENFFYKNFGFDDLFNISINFLLFVRNLVVCLQFVYEKEKIINTVF